MAFVFTVETGAIISGANSYVSVAEADDYFALDPNFNTVWVALADDVKEQLLAWSSRILDQKCLWNGIPVTATQPVRWPRRGAYDRDRYMVSETTIPRQLKEAVCELLKYVRVTDPTVGVDVQSVKRVVADVIEIEFQEGTSQSTVPSILNAILDNLGVYRVGGSGSARIRPTG